MRSGSPALAIGLVLLGSIVAMAIAAPWLAPLDPDAQVDPASSRLRPPGTELAEVRLATSATRPAERWLADGVRWHGDLLVVERLGRTFEVPRTRVLNPTPDGVADRRSFWLGTDPLGRDLWARILHGSRVSLLVAALATGLSLLLGLLVGGVAALGPHWIDSLAMRLVDALMAFPPLVLLLSIVALFRPTLPVLILFLGGTAWLGTSRLVRGELRRLLGGELALAGRALGLTRVQLLFRHLLPNSWSPILVDTSLKVGNVVLLEAALSFLGFGVLPPRASLGNLIGAGREVLTSAWWVSTLPGLWVVALVLGAHLVADGWRARLDPVERTEPRDPFALRHRPIAIETPALRRPV